ncbi:hypothetical protein [Alkalicoccobacillus porphyridii]|uniref:Uncharacterized protein n=1 Tax=Alkalicoccobacillus porphyridii TaxID=2597270 RepID=A0A554A0D5_9BACI|nr:hypothetical protein [Alkalicoccobacillus porphyridii]TSB47148.1 hypothetical protein FN960_09065 [Alkalicoccobacillus porphyridii]
MTYKTPGGREKPLGNGEATYLYNHVAVLGTDRGCAQVAHQLDITPREVERLFYIMHKEKRAHQMAV